MNDHSLSFRLSFSPWDWEESAHWTVFLPQWFIPSSLKIGLTDCYRSAMHWACCMACPVPACKAIALLQIAFGAINCGLLYLPSIHELPHPVFVSKALFYLEFSKLFWHESKECLKVCTWHFLLDGWLSISYWHMHTDSCRIVVTSHEELCIVIIDCFHDGLPRKYPFVYHMKICKNVKSTCI